MWGDDRKREGIGVENANVVRVERHENDLAWGLGFRVQGLVLGVRVQGLGVEVKDSGSRV